MADYPEDSQLEDVPVAISRSFKHNCKRRICSIQDLPSPILVNIVSRLQIKSIFNCKRVCKEWYRLITDPYFVKSILESPPLVSVLLSFDNVLSYLLKLKARNDCILSVNKAIYIRKKIKPNSKVAIIGCCNGLLCLLHGNRYSNDHGLYISNPILGECVKILQPTMRRVHGFAYGFGCSSTTGEFKILRIAKKKYVRKPLRSKAEVYTIGVDHSWRDVGEAPFPYFRKICRVNLNGALHWIEEGDPGSEVHLFSFDIQEEKVQAVPSPHGLSGIFMMELGVLRNCLCIFHSNWSQDFDIWWMRDYGVRESWTRDRILKNWIPRDFLFPITIWRYGEILMVTSRGELFSYDPEEKKTTRVKVSNMVGSGCCDAILYAPNFSSLKSVMGEHVQMVNVRPKS